MGSFFNYQYIFWKTLHEGKYFQWIQKVLETYYNLNKCIPMWSIDKCQLFHKELSTQLKSFLKQCVEWSLMFNQFYLFIKGVGGMSKLWCSANSGTKWTINFASLYHDWSWPGINKVVYIYNVRSLVSKGFQDTFTCIEWTVLSLLMSNYLDRSSHDLHTMTSKSIEVIVFGSKCTNIPWLVSMKQWVLEKQWTE